LSNQIIIQILKSPHHKAFHQDRTICRKKNIKIHKAQITQFKTGFSKIFISGKIFLKTNIETQISIRISKSYISFNSFSIMTYNPHKIVIHRIRLEIISIFWLQIQLGRILFISKK